MREQWFDICGCGISVRAVMLPSRRAFVRYAKKTRGTDLSFDIRRTVAWAQKYGEDSGRPLSEFGEVVFWSGAADLDTVSHECFHIGYGIMIAWQTIDEDCMPKDVRLNPVRHEESGASVCGELTSAVWKWICEVDAA
nr:hypothetical protein [uncultured Rhodopila sp.]